MVAYHRDRVYVRGVLLNSPNGLVLSARHGEKRGTYGSTTIPAFAGDTGYFNDGTLRAKDLTDLSSSIWSFAGDGSLTSAPIVVNGWVFVGSSSGTIYARRKNTGKGAWRADVGAEVPVPDEQNVSQPLTGLGAGEGLLVVPA
jgi:outer membrane protein assembly factor BamB